MAERRPRRYTDAPAARTDDQRLRATERFVEKAPDPDGLWSKDRPESLFGTGVEPEWTATGDGSTVTFAIAGRLATSPARYRVMVGGVVQAPTAYTIDADPAETITFAVSPPAGVTIHITAPFYGAAS